MSSNAGSHSTGRVYSQLSGVTHIAICVNRMNRDVGKLVEARKISSIYRLMTSSVCSIFKTRRRKYFRSTEESRGTDRRLHNNDARLGLCRVSIDKWIE